MISILFVIRIVFKPVTTHRCASNTCNIVIELCVCVVYGATDHDKATGTLNKINQSILIFIYYLISTKVTRGVDFCAL